MIDDEGLIDEPDKGLSRQTYRYLYYLMLATTIMLIFAFWWTRIAYQRRVEEVSRCAGHATLRPAP